MGEAQPELVAREVFPDDWCVETGAREVERTSLGLPASGPETTEWTTCAYLIGQNSQ
jgi:hypothetical protein